jgi:2-amino-4-hydroxy-6-hydroxymethyldihydropteridine diphosphokinase
MIAPAAPTTTAYIGLGSNLSGPKRQLERALGRLEASPAIQVTKISGLYRSAPLGGIEQPAFLNAVAEVRTSLDARELLVELQAIETRLGRDRNVRRWGPRNIDLDLLAHGSLRVDEPDLEIPHPGIAERNFVLLPLRDIAPDLALPGIGRIGDCAVPAEPVIEKISDGSWADD